MERKEDEIYHLDGEPLHERRKINHFRLDQETFDAIIDKSAERAINKLEERLFILIGKAIVDKLIFMITIIGGLVYMYFHDIFKK